MYDLSRVRDDFPILKRMIGSEPLVYLDNAATSMKPRSVIDALVEVAVMTSSPPASWRKSLAATTPSDSRPCSAPAALAPCCAAAIATVFAW